MRGVQLHSEERPGQKGFHHARLGGPKPPRGQLGQTTSILVGAGLGAVGGSLASALLYRLIGSSIAATQGYLSGLVTVSGQAVNGVGVVAIATTGGAWTTTTNATGYFELNLPAGAYQVSAQASGGALTPIGAVTLKIGSPAVVNGDV